MVVEEGLIACLLPCMYSTFWICNVLAPIQHVIRGRGARQGSPPHCPTEIRSGMTFAPRVQGLLRQGLNGKTELKK